MRTYLVINYVTEKSNWVLHTMSVAVLLAWTELMLLIGRFPTYGYYALMFAAVLQNVVKVNIFSESKQCNYQLKIC